MPKNVKTATFWYEPFGTPVFTHDKYNNKNNNVMKFAKAANAHYIH